MKAQEAIDILHENKPTTDPSKSAIDLCEAINTAVLALERYEAVPPICRKKPENKDTAGDYDCPYCRNNIFLQPKDPIVMYCIYCGQAIDWSEE